MTNTRRVVFVAVPAAEPAAAPAARRNGGGMAAAAAAAESDSEFDDDPADPVADWLGCADGAEALGWLRRARHA